jgi:hypothetical protein
LTAVLAPRALELARRAAGQTRPAASARIEVELGTPNWQPALAALVLALQDRAWRAGGLRVALSNHFLRFVILEPNKNLSGHGEKLQYARFQMRSVHGPKADDWVIALAPEGDLAVAMDRELRDGLFAAARGARMSIAAIEPLYAALYNRWRDHLDGERVVFALAESERLCVGARGPKAWEMLDNRRLTSDTSEELSEVLAQSLAGRETQRVYLLAPAHTAVNTDHGIAALTLDSAPLAGGAALCGALFGNQ